MHLIGLGWFGFIDARTTTKAAPFSVWKQDELIPGEKLPNCTDKTWDNPIKRTSTLCNCYQCPGKFGDSQGTQRGETSHNLAALTARSAGGRHPGLCRVPLQQTVDSHLYCPQGRAPRQILYFPPLFGVPLTSKLSSLLFGFNSEAATISIATSSTISIIFYPW